MPITIEYQPSLIDAGLLAYQGGAGQYALQREEVDLRRQSLAQQDSHFNQQLRFAAYQDRNRQDLLQQQLAGRQYEANLAFQAQREQGVNSLLQQRMVQEGYANTARMNYQEAVMREQAAVARQQMVQKNAVAMKQLESMEAFINRNQLPFEQVEQLYQQFEQTHGWNPGNFRTEVVLEAQRAQDDAQKAQQAAGLAQAFGVDPETAESWMMYDPQVGWTISPTGQMLGQATLSERQRQDSAKRYEDQASLEKRQQDLQLQIKEMELGVKAQEQQAKIQEEQEKAAAEVLKKSLDAWTKTQAAKSKAIKFQQQEAKASMAAGYGYKSKKLDPMGLGFHTVTGSMQEQESQVEAMVPGTMFVWFAPQKVILKDEKNREVGEVEGGQPVLMYRAANGEIYPVKLDEETGIPGAWK
jgi:hypothetical protein